MTGVTLAPLGTPWLHVVGGPALVVLAVLVAVAVPVRRDLRLPVVAQLAARREGSATPPRRRAALVVLAVGGVCAVLAAAQGRPLLAPLGAAAWGVAAVLAVPWLLAAAARHAADLPLAWRLAVRDAGRLAGRTAPVVVGVLAVASVALQFVVLVASVTAAHGGPARDAALVVGPGAAGLARDALGRDDVVAASPLRAATRHGAPIEARVDGRRGWIAVGDAALAAALGLDASGDMPLALVDDGDDPVTVRVGDATFTAHRAPRPSPHAPLVVVSPAFAAARGWTSAPPPGRALTPWLVRFAGRIDARLDAHTSDVARIESSGRPHDAGTHAALLAGLFATALAVVACIAGLDATESARDAAILSHLGAAPALVARVAAARAAWVALVGCALAVPASVVPVVAWTTLADVPLPVSIPWAPVALVLPGLPLLTGLGMRVVAAARSIV